MNTNSPRSQTRVLPIDDEQFIAGSVRESFSVHAHAASPRSGAAPRPQFVPVLSEFILKGLPT